VYFCFICLFFFPLSVLLIISFLACVLPSPLLKMAFDMLLYSEVPELASLATEAIVAAIFLSANKKQGPLREVLYPMVYALQPVSPGARSHLPAPSATLIRPASRPPSFPGV
jgi:hypothetical protein